MMRLVPVVMLAIVCASTESRAQNATVDGARDPYGHLEEILDRPLFQRWKLRQERATTDDSQFNSLDFKSELLDSISQVIDDFLRKIGNWLRRLFPKRTAPAPSSSSWLTGLGGIAGILRLLGWMALAALVIFLAVLGYHLVRDVDPSVGAAQVLSREQVKAALEAGEALALASPQWLQEAERLAGLHDFRAVYRALYLALLSGLHSAGKIDFRKNRTNWMYVSRFRGGRDDRDVFSSLTQLFDEVWYGLKKAEGASIDMLKRQVAELLAVEVPHV